MTNVQIELVDEVAKMVSFYQGRVISMWESDNRDKAVADREAATSLYIEACTVNEDILLDTRDFLSSFDDNAEPVSIWTAFQGTIGCSCLVGKTVDELNSISVDDFCDCGSEDEGECAMNKLALAKLFTVYDESK